MRPPVWGGPGDLIDVGSTAATFCNGASYSSRQAEQKQECGRSTLESRIEHVENTYVKKWGKSEQKIAKKMGGKWAFVIWGTERAILAIWGANFLVILHSRVQNRTRAWKAHL